MVIWHFIFALIKQEFDYIQVTESYVIKFTF